MSNLTITVEDDLLRRARQKATEEGTSINAAIRDFLEEWTARRQTYRRAAADFVRIVDEAGAGSGGRNWTRDDLYER
jgi:post-segregation antitoxin (ccd killing protein)